MNSESTICRSRAPLPESSSGRSAHCAVRGSIFALLVMAGSCGEETDVGPSPPDERPNLVIVTLDTTRRDSMGFLGRRPSPTPVLDELAAECLVFEDAFAPAPLTLPSHSSLMTGLSPHRHSVRDNSAFRLPPEAWTLAEELCESGYHTAAAVSAYVLDADFGIDQGFGTYRSPAREPGKGGSFMTELPANTTVDRALSLLDAVDGPFFLWVHLFDPHFPYEPPVRPPRLPRDSLARARALYEAEIRFADRELGRLFARLRVDHHWDRSVLVFAADHGEWVGEEGPETTHGAYIFDPTMRIPLMIKAPGVEPGRVRGPVSLVDVMPTVLELLGRTPPAALDGRDLAPALRAGGDLDPDGLVDLESYSLYLGHQAAPYEGLVDARYKLIHGRDDVLVDRRQGEFADGRLRDVAAEHPQVVARMRAELERRFAEPEALPQSGIQADPVLLQRLGYTLGTRPRDGTRPENVHELADGLELRSMLAAMDEVTGAIVENRWDDVLRLLEPLRREHPGSAQIHEQYGVACFSVALGHEEPRRGEFLSRAAESLGAAISLQFERVRAHYNLALVYRHQAKRSHALAARFADRGFDEAVDARAEALGLDQRAREHFEFAVQLEPTYPEALVNLAGMEKALAERLVAEGDAEGAVEKYRSAVSRLRVFLDTVPKRHRDWPRFAEQVKQYEARIAELR